MRRYLRIPMLAVLFTTMLTCACYPREVSVTETVKTIPTHNYEQGLYMPLPQDILDAYPYPDLKLHEVDSKATPRDYRTVVLENDYLKMTVLPELGCRIIQLIYKPTGQSVFYENDSLKPNHFCEQGWWMSTGGMEFCYPLTEHSTNILKPWVYSIQKHADGSATITGSDTHQRTGLAESVSITLRPDSCALGIHIRLSNPGFTSKPFLFWINPMLPANDEIELIVPTDKMMGFNDLAWDWPVDKGTDYSRHANWKTDNSMFAARLYAGFVGMYDHSRKLGLVRSIPYPQARGVKVFSWGHTKLPALQPKVYSDSEKPYFELWGGYTPSFWDEATLAPHGVVEWNEDWYPVSATDGFKTASADIAVNVKIDQDQVALTFFPSRDIKSAKIELGSGNRKLWVGNEDFQCGKVVTKNIPLQSGLKPEYVNVFEGKNKLLNGLQEKPKNINKQKLEIVHSVARDKRRSRPEPSTVAELVAKDQIDEAIKLYESTRSARSKTDYCFALVRAGRYDDASKRLEKIKSNSLGAYMAGTLALRKNDAAAARSMFGTAVKLNPRDADALAAMGAVWASEDRVKAESYLTEALKLEPNNLVALAELADMGNEQAKSRLEAALADTQNGTYLALDYLGLGMLSKAETYARKSADVEPNNATALVALFVAQVRAGKTDADETLLNLHKIDVDESIVYSGDSAVMVLEEAVRARPKDSRLLAALATAYQARESDDMAFEMAKRSTDIEPEIAKAHFIQAQTLQRKYRRQGDIKHVREAAKSVDKCLALKPTILPYYLLGSWIYEEAGRERASVAAMQKLHEVDPKSEFPYETFGWEELDEKSNYTEAIRWFKLEAANPTPNDQRGSGNVLRAYSRWMKNLLYDNQLDKLAAVYQEAKDYRKSQEYVSKFADLEFSCTTAKAAEALGKQDEARKSLEEIKAQKDDLRNNGWMRDWYYVACALDMLGEKDEARSIWTMCKNELEPIVKESPDWDYGLYLMAITQNKLGQPGEALTTFNKISKRQRTSGEFKADYEEILAASKAKQP